MPFGKYADFQDCVDQNGDKADPAGYCATIMRNVEGKAFEETITVRHGMAALYLDPASASLLSLPASRDLVDAGGKVTPPEEMHVTLCYFPEIKDEDVDGLIQQVAMAAMGCGPLQTVVEGAARFLPSESSDGGVPHVLLVDPTSLYPLAMMLRDCCESATEIADDHGWIAHITQAYAPAGYELTTKLPAPLQLSFDTLTLMIGDERHDFRLGGMPDMAMGMRGKVAQQPQTDRSSARPSVVSRLGMGMSTETITKAVWTTAFINDLPDSSFLFIESGGKKVDGKTEPRSLRHFPVRDSSGAIDLPHLRNALARIPQSNAPGLNKEAVTARAQRMLEEANKAEKAGRRMSASWRDRVAGALDTLKSVLMWADYEDQTEPPEEPMDDMMDDAAMPQMGKKEFPQNGFFVFKDHRGDQRWLSFSSNGFKDREDEIVSTACLEEAVEYSDKTDSRGPLRLWHIKGADIGACDFQGVQGRFLIESGTFLDTELARRAKAYFERTDEKLGVSIGFMYPEDQFDGRVYRSIRFLERSVVPLASAANPWTSFLTLKGEDDMNSNKADWLRGMVGEDLTDSVLKAADSATKGLESQVAFKSTDPLLAALTSVKAALGDNPPDEVKTAFAAFVKSLDGAGAGAAGDQTVPEGAPEEQQKAVALPEVVEVIKELITPLASAMTAIVDRVKAIEETQVAQKAAEESNRPRGADIFRASSSEANLLDAGKAVEAFGKNDAPTSGAAAYVADLLKNGASHSA